MLRNYSFCHSATALNSPADVLSMRQPQLTNSRRRILIGIKITCDSLKICSDMHNYVENMQEFVCTGQNMHAYVYVRISRNMTFYAR